MDTRLRPSERFCKHGFLTESEKYDQRLHSYGKTVEDRCRNYYTQEEIQRMKNEIRVAECAICLLHLTDTNDCIVCSDGHKFHNNCITDYWTINPGNQNVCPISNSIPKYGWKMCVDINDYNSGGRRKISKKKKTSRKKKSKKTKKSKK
jgi:hypothetical protein